MAFFPRNSSRGALTATVPPHLLKGWKKFITANFSGCLKIPRSADSRVFSHPFSPLRRKAPGTRYINGSYCIYQQFRDINEDTGSFCSLLTHYLCVHAVLSKRIFDCRLNCNKSHLSDTKFSSVASSLKEHHSTTLHSFYLQTGIFTVSWIQSRRFLGRRLDIILWCFFVCGCLLEATIS